MLGFNIVCSAVGKALAKYLSKPNPLYQPLATTDPEKLAAVLRPGDVLLVEGNSRVATAIKYLTQSTWSHAALYVGPRPGLATREGEPRVLIEADMVEGVWAVPISAYSGMHTRICRPVGLGETDVRQVVDFAVGSLGKKYDLRNVIDLARYLVPVPPVPTRWRGTLLYLGSGEPTTAICSTLIAQAFQSVRYPILPIESADPTQPPGPGRYIFTRRHYSLFVPRDFDISPYFEVVKPTLASGFEFRALRWSDQPTAPMAACGRFTEAPTGDAATGHPPG
jgi:hypothetical protein